MPPNPAHYFRIYTIIQSALCTNCFNDFISSLFHTFNTTIQAFSLPGTRKEVENAWEKLKDPSCKKYWSTLENIVERNFKTNVSTIVIL